MLLTLPYFLSFMVGGQSPKGKERNFFTQTISYSHEITRGAKLMMLTMLPYLIIQLPAFSLGCADSRGGHCNKAGEQIWAKVALFGCLAGLAGYMVRT